MQLAQRLVLISLCLAFAAGPAHAQLPQILPPGAIEEALADRTADVAAQRQAIRAALQQPDVQRVAEHLGLDVARAERAIATLGGVELERIAAQAQLVNEAVAGGQTVRLNLLWIVIGLLIVIIILVA
jgi:hypothetical protein